MDYGRVDCICFWLFERSRDESVCKFGAKKREITLVHNGGNCHLCGRQCFCNFKWSCEIPTIQVFYLIRLRSVQMNRRFCSEGVSATYGSLQVGPRLMPTLTYGDMWLIASKRGIAMKHLRPTWRPAILTSILWSPDAGSLEWLLVIYLFLGLQSPAWARLSWTRTLLCSTEIHTRC